MGPAAGAVVLCACVRFLVAVPTACRVHALPFHGVRCSGSGAAVLTVQAVRASPAHCAPAPKSSSQCPHALTSKPHTRLTLCPLCGHPPSQNLMGALKLPLGGRSQPGAPQRTARAAHLPGTATPPAHSGSPDMAGGQMLRGGLPASGTSTPLPGKIAPIATAAAVAGGVGERTDATAVLHVASGATVGMVH